MALRYYRNGPQRSLSAAIANSTDTTMTIDSVSGFPTQFPYTLILEPNTALEEVVDVTAATGNTLTIVRGVDSTTASAHGAGTPVYHGISARDPREANAHVNTTSGIHGATGALVDTDSVQTINGRKLFADAESATGGNLIDTGTAQSITGAKTFDTLSTTAGGAVVAVGGAAQTITGDKSFTGLTTLASTVIDGVNVVNNWTPFTPSWLNGDGAALAIGNGTLQGRSQRIGKSVKFRIELIRGSTSSAGSSYYIFALPVSPLTYRINGTATVYDTSAGRMYPCTWHGINTNQIVLVDPTTGSRVAWNSPMAWATGDEIVICGEYEAA